MSSLIHDCFAIIAFLVDNPRVGEGSKIFLIISLIIDFIESHPVFDFILVALKNDFRKAYKEVNHLTVFPTTILGYQMIGHFKVRQSDNRLNTILKAFIKKVVIKLQAGFIRLYFISFRENPSPGNRSPETLEAHLRKKSNISLVTMIKINSFVIWVVFSWQHSCRNFPRNPVASCGHYISNTDTLSTFLPAAF